MKSLLLAALGVSLILVPGAQGQNPASVRVVRLSRAEGEVFVSHSGSDVWEEAPVNLPLQEGDTLATQGGLAEIEFENGATAFLAENSVLQFTRLGFNGGARATELTLTQGAGTFNASLANQDTFLVHALTFDVALPERAEFRVDGFRDGAAAEVLLGAVTVTTPKGSTNLETGQSIAVHQNDVKDSSIGSLPTAEDAFDRWVTEEGERIRSGNKNTLSYINSPNAYGLSDLSVYGSWINLPGFGFSWRPFSVGFSWTPYFNGKWILDPRLGWIWVSNEAWGWTPYHFGSWLLSPILGWVWVPGGAGGLRNWEAARVNWVQVGNQVGWVAKSPNDREGVPANLAKGVITRPVRPTRNGNETHEVVTGKELQSVAPLKQPPQESAFSPRPGAPVEMRPGTKSTTRVAPGASKDNPSIVFDGSTHTFINRDEAGGAGNENNSPAAPPGPMPLSNTQAAVPRVTISPTGPLSSRANRFPPPSYPVAPDSRGNIPANAILPARLPSTAPNIPLRPRVPAGPVPTVAPVPLRGNPGNAATPPSTAHPAKGQSGTEARPATPAPQH